ncbi:MAG: peptidoglycan hydrolase-like protein with peptidoglycan-binding domain [Candidatus Azotimanducaceae bacterium]|jgi:peptidoglycan hydrolase-like protein with peptidoglycan-binding domain
MTLANSVFMKASVAFVALATAFVLAAPAQAQMTESEMEAKIAELTALIATLTGSLNDDDSTMSSSSACPYTWTRSLLSGDTGADVMKLQQFLNSSSDTRVAASGAGSVGAETDYYGPATAAAVSSLQTKYRTDILSPAGLVNPTGYFGPSTMAKANMLCASAPVMNDDVAVDDSSDDDDSSSSNSDGLSGGETDVNSLQGRDEEDEVAEGEEDVAVHRVEFDVEDGDAMLKRVDLTFDNSAIGATGEADPWDVFDEISIWVDGDKIASEDATDEGDWDESGNIFDFRITGLDTIFEEDTTGEIVFAVSIVSGVDVSGVATEDDWDVYTKADGLRFTDSEDIDTEVGTGAADASTFEIIEEGDNDDLDLESSDEDPDGTTLAVDEDDKVEAVIFAVDLSAEDSDNDIELDDITFHVVVGGTDGTSVNAFVDDFRLEIGGESFGADTYVGTGLSADIFFDIDGDVTIDADDLATAVLYAEFEDVASVFVDATIIASTSASDVDADGADDVVVTGGTKTGNTHTVRLEGLTMSAEPSDGKDTSDSVHEVSGVAVDSNYGTMFLEFEVTAFGDDLWVAAASSTRGAATVGTGVAYQILDSGTATTGGAVSIDYDIEGADEDNGFFELEEGETYTMVVTIESYNPTDEGTYSFRLNSIGFSDTEDAIADATAVPDDTTEYVSDSTLIQS